MIGFVFRLIERFIRPRPKIVFEPDFDLEDSDDEQTGD